MAGYKSLLAFWCGGAASGIAPLSGYDKDAIKFTHSERQNKAIQAGFITKAVGISNMFKAVKR